MEEAKGIEPLWGAHAAGAEAEEHKPEPMRREEPPLEARRERVSAATGTLTAAMIEPEAKSGQGSDMLEAE